MSCMARTVLDLTDFHCGLLREIMLFGRAGIRIVPVCFEPAPQNTQLILAMIAPTIEPSSVQPGGMLEAERISIVVLIS